MKQYRLMLWLLLALALLGGSDLWLPEMPCGAVVHTIRTFDLCWVKF